MRKTGWSILLALASIATLAGCRCTCDSALGHYDWSLGQSHAAADCPPQAGRLAQARRKCPPSEAQQAALTSPPPAVSVDAPASSELVPLPTRPVFGARMDGRQAGVVQPASDDEPAAEPVAIPPANATPATSPAPTSTSLKLRRRDPPAAAAQ